MSREIAIKASTTDRLQSPSRAARPTSQKSPSVSSVIVANPAFDASVPASLQQALVRQNSSLSLIRGSRELLSSRKSSTTFSFPSEVSSGLFYALDVV